MFYSHEILTSRKYGVATIWLMATLGTRSGHKKITRRAILDVNLPKACETVTEPEKPLALRLQGSLLVGISRVFGQQCEYMMQDTDSLRTRMKKVVRPRDAKQIDPAVITRRPEYLNLPEDPAFDVDFDLDLDFSIFDFSADGLVKTGLPSLISHDTTQSSLRIREQQSSLQFSSSHPDGESTDDALSGPAHFQQASMDSYDNSDTALGNVYTEQAIYHNTDMHVDDDGQLVFASDPINLPIILPQTSEDVVRGGVPEYSQHTQAIQQNEDPFINTQAGDEDWWQQNARADTDQIGLLADDARNLAPFSAHNLDTAAAAVAVQGHTRRGKPAQLDRRTELTATQLNGWTSNHLRNMADSRGSRLHHESVAQARRNAAFWILDQGIGGVEVNFGKDAATHPLSIFSGQSLLDALQMSVSIKRPRSVYDSDEEDQHRRIRVRSLVPEGASEALGYLHDDLLPESQVGRRAEGSLKDHSSQMPWNISSRQGSARLYGSALHRMSSVTGSAGGFELGPPSSILRHRTRLTSASPLVGKGRPFSPDEVFDHGIQSNLSYGMDDFDNLDRDLGGDLGDDFNLYGPAAAVSTQQAAESQWLATTLESEGQNFLDFLTTSIRDQAAYDDPSTTSTITFETLLNPSQNSRIVAAQALLHVLTLATKGLIEVDQEEDFGDIALMLSE